MMLWLYTEEESPWRDGPFFDLERAMRSPLWELPKVCAWIVDHTAAGWVFEHVKWKGDGWVITSRGAWSIPPYVPECLTRATDRTLRDRSAGMPAGCGRPATAPAGRRPFLVQSQRN